MKTYLTVTPPGPVTDKAELDIRWTIDAGKRTCCDVKVTLTCNGKQIGRTESFQSINDIVNGRVRIKTAGMKGIYIFNLVVSAADCSIPIVSRNIAIIPSSIPTTKLISGAWMGLTHWSEEEGLYWNNELKQFTDDDWRETMREMKAIGIETIIIQETWRNPVWYGRHYHQMTAKNYRETYAGRAYYPSRLWPGRVELPCKDPVGAILDEADKQKMRVFLGIGLYAHFDYTPGSLAWHLDVMKELWKMYGHHDSLHGWYISEELSGPIRPHEQRYWDATDQFREEVMTFFRAMHEAVGSLCPHMPIMIAPDSNFSEALSVWEKLVGYCDVICVQGYQRSSKDGISAEESMRRMQTLCDSAGSHHWLDLEIFGFEHPDKHGPQREGYTKLLSDGTEQWIPTPLIPQPMELLKREMEELNQVEYICAYQYPGLMAAPDARLKPGGERAVMLYQEYKKYWQGIINKSE